ncbi:ribonuclease III domain-containing protein [Pholiota molesta]|nr:ribonuclease III domain-containing protein [Pholiota molesta]
MSMFPFVDPKSIECRGVSLSQASWDIVLHDSRERERLEFLGDALIGASISEELFRCWPNEGPGFYTKARSVLTANSTFAHIMQRLGFHNDNQPVKPTGDAFETILAAYHSERGLDAFNQYVRQSFSSLIQCVGHTYHDSTANELHARKLRIQLQQKQHQISTDALLHGNVKRRRRKPNSNSPPPMHESEISPPKNPAISGPSSSRKKLAKTTTQHRMQHRDVPGISVEKSKANLNHVPPTHSAKIESTGKMDSESILRWAASVPPRICRAAKTNSSLTASRRNIKVDQDDLVVLLSQTSLKLPGSVTNPITIDD